MEGKRLVSRSPQLGIEAFAPWVRDRLNHLLGVPPYEKSELENRLRKWREHECSVSFVAMGLEEKPVGFLEDADFNMKQVLGPWVEHELIDLLWSQEKDEAKIVAGVKSNFHMRFRHFIDVFGLNNTFEKRLEVILPQFEMRELHSGRVAASAGLASRKMRRHVDDVLSTLSKEVLSDQLKIDRPEIVQVTRTKLGVLLTKAKDVLDDDLYTKISGEVWVWEWVDDFFGVSYDIIAALEEWKSNATAQVTSSVPSRAKKPDTYATKLKELNNKVDSLISSRDFIEYLYKALFDFTFKDLPRRRFHGPEVRCREDDIESVVEHLLLPTAEGEPLVKVMSIVGCGGSGKTSLARFVYNDPAVRKHFQLRAWGPVSNVFDVKEIANSLLKDIGIEVCVDMELDSVALLEESLSGKVFLCVLDDVWTEDSDKWMTFTCLLRNSAPGSKILVTTRSEKVAQLVSTDWKHQLKPLSNKDWWLIWKIHLNLSTKHKISKHMFNIGSNIADKCQRLPLAAIALAEILYYRKTDAEAWQGELKKVSDMGDEIWRIEGVGSELFRQFSSYYGVLPPELKLCILYCADFDKGTVIAVDQLIRMWMAHGYVGDSSEEDSVNMKTGLEYLHNLALGSVFRELVKGSIHKNTITSCKLNDEFHDFIRYKARHDFIRYKARHDCTAISRYSAVFHEYSAVQKRGRERHFHVKLYGQVPETFDCERWKDVLTLVLSSSQLDKVPSGLGELSRVEYLDLSNNPFKELPETICKLECLQYLDVHRCYLLLRLPHDLNKLKQLKHLRVDCTTDELHKRLPKGFEELTSIRTLDHFRTGGSVYKNAMEKLKKFTHLTDICIRVHGEVKFSDAKFHAKTHLANLELCFVEEGLDQEKMSGFMMDSDPPPNLVMLKLDNYPLMELPKWLLQETVQLQTLTRLSFRSALNITSFPALWKLPSLEFLWLYDIPKLKCLGREFFGLPDTLQLKTSDFPIDVPDDMEGEDLDFIMDDEEIPAPLEEADKTFKHFPKLITLRIECMKNLEKWQDITGEEKKESRVSVMPSLEELITPGWPKHVEKPLCILRDTPWFKRTIPTNPVKDAPQKEEGSSSLPKKKEENVPPPSQKESSSLPEEDEEEKNVQPPSEKESCSLPEQREEVTETSIPDEYVVPSVAKNRQGESNGLPDQPTSSGEDSESTRLRKFVHDSYITKGLTDNFVVSIPKGVLKNTEVTACLSPKDLYEWLQQPDGWIFAEQLCIWSKHIYEEHMTPTDKERVQIVSGALITTVGRNYEKHPDTRSEDLVNFMMQNQASLYMVPYLRPGHWELLAIVPKNEAVYRFDSLQANPEIDLTDLWERVKKYVSKTPSSNQLLKSSTIKDIKYKRQAGNWECGYYVMLWMREIATTDFKCLDLKEHYILDDDETPHEPAELEELKQNWCAYFSSIVQKK